MDKAISLDFDHHPPEALAPLLRVFGELNIPAYFGPGTTRGSRFWLFPSETERLESLAQGLARLAKALGFWSVEGYPNGRKPVILPFFGALNGNPRPLYDLSGNPASLPFRPQEASREALVRLVKAGELLQAALSHRPPSRHDALLAFLNLAHRLGVLEEAKVLFGHEVLWKAWGLEDDGSRSLAAWQDEVERAAEAARSSEYGHKRGLGYLKEAGFSLKVLGEVAAQILWPKPVPLETLSQPLPRWPQGLLPGPVEDFVYRWSEAKAVEPTPLAMATLTVASAILAARGVEVLPEPGNATWREPSVLWTLIIAPPGFGKSPLLRAAADPILALKGELADENAALEEAFRLELAAWEATPRKERGPKPAAPPRRRLLVSDATPEALAEILAVNPAVLALLDEVKGLLTTWRREDRAHGRAFFLSCYSGEPAVVDRITRGTVYLKRPLLALLGAIQPGPWHQVVEEARRLGSEADGLLQRLVPVVGELLPYTSKPSPVPDAVLTGYRTAIRRLWEDQRLKDLSLQPTKDAYNLWRDWRADTEEAIRDISLPEAWRSYLGKRLGLTARIAGILAALWGEESISERSMGLAIILVGDVLEAHAKKAWRVQSLDISPAVRLGKALLKDRPERFTRRDVYRNEWGGITSAQEAEAAIAVLLRAGWLEEVLEGRRVVYRVNPRVEEVTHA